METYSYILLSLLCQLSVGDHDSYGYSDYQPHTTANHSQARSNGGKKRVFDDALAAAAASVSLNLRASIPLADLNSRITISAPFVFDFPVQSERGATDYFGLGDFATGRSFSGGEATRMAMYKEVETYVSRLLGADGHSCLLRAMCETSANPLHNDGILGDAMNFLMTGSYSAADSLSSEKSYFEAQAKGQLSGDCSAYSQECPVSFFKYLG